MAAEQFVLRSQFSLNFICDTRHRLGYDCITAEQRKKETAWGATDVLLLLRGQSTQCLILIGIDTASDPFILQGFIRFNLITA